MSSTKLPVFTFASALKFGVGMGALAATLAAPAFAQDADEAAEEGVRKLQTVTVTATKREQTLQDIPVAVSVVGEEDITKAEIQDLGDLQSLVPSLSVGQLQSSANTNFIIRGFGNGANNVGIEPSVGVFIDGVYRSRSAAQISDLPNIQRVEVLRGPQSTLFGKNASAGVISIVTQKPQFDWGGSVSATAGNFNTQRIKGDITGPISDKAAFSLGAYYNTRDGYAENLVDGSELNERNRYGIRGSVLFEPTDNLSMRLIADYDSIDENCCVAANLVDAPGINFALAAANGQVNARDPFSYEVFSNFDSINEIDNRGLSLQSDYDFSNITLTSITAYREVTSLTDQDSDFTSADLIGKNENDGEIKTFTQELRLTSDYADSRVDWMVGGFYFDESVDVTDDFEYGADFRAYTDTLVTLLGAPGALGGLEAGLFGAPAVGTVFGQEGQGPEAEYGQNNIAWSVFGTADIHILDSLTLTLGVNHTKDIKDAYYRQTSNTDVFSSLDLVAIGFAQGLGSFNVDATDPAAVGAFAAANPVVFGQLVAGSQDPATNPLLGLQALQFLPPLVDFPNQVEDGKTNDEQTTYTARLAWDITDNLNVYGSYATGFKASSWNLSRDSRPFASDFIAGSPVTSPAPSPIRTAGLAQPNLISGTRFAGPEDSEVFEIGMKGAFDRFAFNLAVFDQKIEGFQSNIFTGTGFILANAGEQSVLGAEADITAQLFDGFTITAAATLLDPEYNSFTETGIAADPTLPFDPDTNQLDLSGTTPSGIPEISSSIAANYDFSIGSADVFVRGDWQYQDDTAFFDDPVQAAIIKDAGYSREVSQVNFSTGVTLSNDLAISLWGRNIFDEERITTAFPSVAQSGSFSGYPSQPRTYGVTLRKSW